MTMVNENVHELVKDTLILESPFSAMKTKYHESQHELINIPIDAILSSKVITDHAKMLVSVGVLSTTEDFDTLVSNITPYQAMYLRDGYSNALDAVLPVEIRNVNPF